MNASLAEQTAGRRAALRVQPVSDDGGWWDAFVRHSPAGSVYHLWGWRYVMADVLRHRPHYLAAVDCDGHWHGVLPLVHIGSALFGRYVVSLPFLNGGGPLGTPDARRQLTEAAVVEARRVRADLLELRSQERVPGPVTQTHRKLTVLLDLPPTPAELWNGVFPSKLRSQIRRAMGAGFSVRFGSHSLDAFYRVFARHMRDLGTPALPREFFAALAERFPAEVLFAAVFDGERPIAGGCGFFWGEEFEIHWAAALRTYSRTAPNMLLYWAVMEQAIRHGARRFNFGRCSPGSGTHRFKRQWGGRDLPLPWAQWSPRGLTAPPTPDRPVFRAAARVWQHLPLAIANAAGRRLARLLP